MGEEGGGRRGGKGQEGGKGGRKEGGGAEEGGRGGAERRVEEQ